jgi:Amt family ammonium transporter
MALATLGTMILWFGWYGFNPGSTLGLGGGAPAGVGTFSSWTSLVVVNTTLAAAAGGVTSMIFSFFRTRKWDLPSSMNGTLAGLVGITASCAYVSPAGAILVGIVTGVAVLLATDLLEVLKIDDPVGAFPVHGVCGILGTLSIGFLADPSLTFNTVMAGKAGLLYGGGFELLGVQAFGSFSSVVYVAITAAIMFGLLKVINRLRVNKAADVVGIDVYEHGASIWPDMLPLPDDGSLAASEKRATAPATGD